MRKFKVYNKCNAWLLSKSAQSLLGMNTNALYTQKPVMSSVIKEASNTGLTRMEVSYCAKEPTALKKIFSDSFLNEAKSDIRSFEECINRVAGICYRVPLLDLLTRFQ